MKIIKASEKPWHKKKGYSKKIFLTGLDLNFPGLVVQTLKIAPGQVAKYHYHKKQTEIFFFINVNGEFFVNGTKMPLEVGDVLVVEPGDHHEVRNTSTEDFLYVAFKYNVDKGDYFESEPK